MAFSRNDKNQSLRSNPAKFIVGESTEHGMEFSAISIWMTQCLTNSASGHRFSIQSSRVVCTWRHLILDHSWDPNI